MNEGLCPILLSPADAPSPFKLVALPAAPVLDLPPSNVAEALGQGGDTPSGQHTDTSSDTDDSSGASAVVWLTLAVGLGAMLAKGYYETQRERQMDVAMNRLRDGRAVSR